MYVEVGVRRRCVKLSPSDGPSCRNNPRYRQSLLHLAYGLNKTIATCDAPRTLAASLSGRNSCERDLTKRMKLNPQGGKSVCILFEYLALTLV